MATTDEMPDTTEPHIVIISQPRVFAMKNRASPTSDNLDIGSQFTIHGSREVVFLCAE
jgi:hypothetical protein